MLTKLKSSGSGNSLTIPKKPLLVLISGVTGSGKSTLAAMLEHRLEMEMLTSS